jgi:NTE family protein
MTMHDRALVLAGGGVAGIAWMLGLIEALLDQGVDVSEPEMIIGTSAGAAVGAQIATRQLVAAVAQQERAETAEIPANVDVQALLAKIAEIRREANNDERAAARRFGQLALEAPTVSEGQRKAAIAARLPSHAWPEQPLRITAVEALTGELVVFDRKAAVPLVDAVAASCAVPGVWPPATIEGRRYLDGGTRSFSNADLADAYARVLIVIPTAPNPLADAKLEAERARLPSSQVVRLDGQSIAAIGANPLDPSKRRPALEAGRRQGRHVASDVAAFWRS